MELRQPCSTLVRPADLSLIPTVFERRNGINRDALVDAPTFADTVYELLHERIWAGHNILRFDCLHIRKAFSELNRPPPEPKAIIDSLPLLTETFGRRAGDMKMASLATYFGLGQQTHRSLDDVRMNLEVIKYCATIMFLESNFPNIFTVNSWVSPSSATRNRSSVKPLFAGSSPLMSINSITQVASQYAEEKRPISPIEMCSSKAYQSNAESCLLDVFESGISPKVAARSCSVGKSLQDKGLSDMKTESMLLSPIATQCSEEKRPTSSSPIAMCSSEGSKLANQVQQFFGYPQPQMTSPAALSEASSSSNFTVLKPHEVFISSLTTSLVPSYHGSLRIQLLHNGFPFQLSCADLRIRFGVNGRFCDKAGRPKLSIVIDASQSLCEVLEACNAISLCSFLDSGSSSEWKPVVVTRKEGSFNYPTVRLRIPISECGDAAILAAELYKKESSSGTVHRLCFNKFDIRELSSLLTPGNLVDAIFSLDQYEYQQSAGIRLVAKKLIFHT